MASITTRVGKGSPLTTQELDANFTNLNKDKLEKSGESASFADLTLSTVSATLHRSPNAIRALFVYDTSKDSDGGAWTEKCQHTSWYNETIYGKWLGAQASESAARAVSGATTNDYYQLTTDGKFYALNAGSGVTEVFRGNKRNFPKLAAIVAEAASVTIYDLTEVGRPMWMRFTLYSTSYTNGYWQQGTHFTATGAIEGQALFTVNFSAVQGLGGIIGFDFANDVLYKCSNNSTDYGYRTTGEAELKVIATRQTLQRVIPSVYPALGDYNNSFVEEMFVGVLPDALANTSFGLKLPTVVLSRDRCLHVVRNMRSSVRSNSANGWSDGFFVGKRLYVYRRTTGALEYASDLTALGNLFTLTSLPSSAAPDFMRGSGGLLINASRMKFCRASGAVVQMMRPNEATLLKSLTTAISDTFNTGWLAGDIRRAYLANSKTADRSYKGATATETGTVTATAVNTGNDLVAYSGFSAANYSQEPYSADLDFSTNEWSVSAWVNVPTTLPTPTALWAEELSKGTSTPNPQASGGATVSQAGTVVTVSGGTYAFLRFAASTSPGVLLADLPAGRKVNVSVSTRVNNLSAYITIAGSATNIVRISNTAINTWETTVIEFTSSGNTNDFLQFLTGAGNTVEWDLATLTIQQYKPHFICSREYTTAPYIWLFVTQSGTLGAYVHAGTTTRTVTTTAAYNTATWTKVRANYTTDGTLALLVNGVQVATTTGTPLLTLNNSNAVLTIGNSYALDAPFPGSLALLKFSASVPTAEQSQWMYEQEKHLFSAGAKCVLPASTAVLDLAYDDATDTWSTLQATYESTFSGLVRTSTQAPSAGSFSKVSAGSGVKLLGRTTTNPGVDVQLPAKNLRPKDMPKDTNQDIVVFDFDAVTSQTDFTLPVGYTARVVYSAGAQQREGSTKAWTRVFDGFRETVRFGTAPGNGVWVQVHAVKEVSL